MLMWYQCNTVVKVALRKESVDRNPPVDTSSVNESVALRKESVDRNINSMTHMQKCCVSLSARRAWIEINHQAVNYTLDPGRSPQGERG